jgi:hypothetical protein
MQHGPVKSVIRSMANNNVTGNVYSDEWYTDQTTVDKAIGLLQPKPRSVIICPFDSDKSLFVTTLKEHGHTVLYGMDNFIENDKYQFDYLITNPPFSIKDKVIQQVYKYGKPSLLMLPLDTLGGVKRGQMYEDFGDPYVVIPRRRISYYDQNMVKRPGAAFHSIYALFNVGKSGIEWVNG